MPWQKCITSLIISSSSLALLRNKVHVYCYNTGPSSTNTHYSIEYRQSPCITTGHVEHKSFPKIWNSRFETKNSTPARCPPKSIRRHPRESATLLLPKYGRNATTVPNGQECRGPCISNPTI